MWKSCLVHPCIQPASGDAQLRGKQQGGQPSPPHTHTTTLNLKTRERRYLRSHPTSDSSPDPNRTLPPLLYRIISLGLLGISFILIFFMFLSLIAEKKIPLKGSVTAVPKAIQRRPGQVDTLNNDQRATLVLLLLKIPVTGLVLNQGLEPCRGIVFKDAKTQTGLVLRCILRARKQAGTTGFLTATLLL